MDLKDKIIQTATELFTKNGFENTPIEEIIRKAGCSKGGFYHHFKSKDEVLEHIIDNLLKELMAYFDQPVVSDDTDFPEQFNQVYDFITGYKINQLEDWKGIKNVFIFSGNERALRTLNRKFTELVKDLYLQLILQGSEKEEITTDYPEETAELCARQVLWIYDSAIKTLKDPNTLDSYETLLDFSEKLIARQLGLKDGQIKYKDCSLEYQKKIIMMYSANEKEQEND